MAIKNVNGYVLHKNRDIQVKTAQFNPLRNAADATAGNFYGAEFKLGGFFTGTTTSHCYGVGITGDRSASYVATGDANDAYLRISGNNYAANDANFYYRGLNVAVNNRSGGSLGVMENLISVQGKSGGTAPTMRALTVKAENYGTTATEFGIADFVSANEANSATTTYGIQVRNDDRSSQAAIQSAVKVASHASSGGFDKLIDGSGAVLTEYDSGTKICLMSFKGANGTTYYLLHDTDAATVLSVNTSLA